MSYPITTPVDFNNDGLIEITYTNTTDPTRTWAFNTDTDANATFSSSDAGNIFKMYHGSTTAVTGVEATTFNFVRGSNRVTISTDPGTTSYGLLWPPSGPTTIQSMVSASPGSSSTVFYSIHADHVITVRKNPGPEEFDSVAAALASIPVSPDPLAPSDSERYVVYINAGQYTEPPMEIPEYVFLVGISMEGCRITHDGSTAAPLIRLGKRTGIAFCTFFDSLASEPTLHFYNCGDYALIHKIEFDNCAKAILIETDSAATERSLCYLEYTATTLSTTYSLYCTDGNTLGGFGSEASIENFFTYDHNDNAVIVDGVNSALLAQACTFQGDSIGDGMYIINGGYAELRGCYFQNWGNAVYIPNIGNTSTTTTLLMAATLYDNCTENINIEKLNVIGHADGYTQYNKTIVPKAAPFFIANKDQNIITVSQKGADFTSIAAALASITTSTAMNRFTIYVGPGIYYEPQLVLKEYVAILGFFQTQTILVATDNNNPFIIGAPYSAVQAVTITGGYGGTAPPYMFEYMGHTSGNQFRAERVAIGTARGIANVGSVNGPCLFLFMQNLINMSSTVTQGFTITDAGPFNFPINFLMDGLIWNPIPSAFVGTQGMFDISSVKAGATMPNINVAIQDCSVGQNVAPQSGVCINLSGPVFAIVESSIIGGWTTGINIQDTYFPTQLLTGSNTLTHNTWDVIVDNINATGTLSGNMAKDKIDLGLNNNFSVGITDPAGNIAVTGTIYQGYDWDKITNITEQIQHAAALGSLASQPGTTYSGLDLFIEGGTGYVWVEDGSYHYLKFINWGATTLVIPDNSFVYVYINNSGQATSSVGAPDYKENIIIVTIKSWQGEITYVQDIAPVISQLSTNIDYTLRNVFGPIVDSGIITQAGSTGDLTLSVTTGSYNLSVLSYPIDTEDIIEFVGYYYGSSANYIETVGMTSVPLMWDNAPGNTTGSSGGYTASITPGKYIKHGLYVLGHNGIDPTQYFLVFAQQEFDTLVDAQLGPMPIPPSFFEGNMCPISGIIVTDGQTGTIPDTNLIDARPTLQFRSTGLSITSDHNSLSNLTVGNAHPQYFRVDGTAVMGGNINLASYNVTGTGTTGNLWNNMDPAQHASRHVPGGADPLPTATPVNISTANSEGVNASFARSDHVHNHGNLAGGALHAAASGTTNGFMSSTDKTRLDGATSSAIASTIMARDTNVRTMLYGMQFQGSNNPASVMTFEPGATSWGIVPISVFLPAVNGTVVYEGNTTALTNKTLTGATLTTAIISGSTVSGSTLANSTITGATVTGTIITSTTNTVTANNLRTTGADVVVGTAAPPTTSQALVATSATTAAWQMVPEIITFSNAQVSVGNGAATVVAYLPWDNTAYSGFTTRTIKMWVVPSATVGKNLTVNVLPNGGASLGTITINGGSAVGALQSFTITNPGANTRLDLQVSRTGNAGANPLIFGVTLTLS